MPEDVPAGIKHRKDPLPTTPLSGMVNKYGSKVRLYFKRDADQLWIGTKGKVSARDYFLPSSFSKLLVLTASFLR